MDKHRTVKVMFQPYLALAFLSLAAGCASVSSSSSSGLRSDNCSTNPVTSACLSSRLEKREDLTQVLSSQLSSAIESPQLKPKIDIEDSREFLTEIPRRLDDCEGSVACLIDLHDQLFLGLLELNQIHVEGQSELSEAFSAFSSELNNQIWVDSIITAHPDDYFMVVKQFDGSSNTPVHQIWITKKHEDRDVSSGIEKLNLDVPGLFNISDVSVATDLVLGQEMLSSGTYLRREIRLVPDSSMQWRLAESIRHEHNIRTIITATYANDYIQSEYSVTSTYEPSACYLSPIAIPKTESIYGFLSQIENSEPILYAIWDRQEFLPGTLMHSLVDELADQELEAFAQYAFLEDRFTLAKELYVLLLERDTSENAAANIDCVNASIKAKTDLG